MPCLTKRLHASRVRATGDVKRRFLAGWCVPPHDMNKILGPKIDVRFELTCPALIFELNNSQVLRKAAL